MFSAAAFTNVSTDTVDLLGSGYALKTLDWSYEYDGSQFPKQQDAGQQPAHSFVRRVVVNITVQLLGSSQSAYWTSRNTFAKAFLVRDGAQTDYQHGRLTVTPQGGSAMYLDCNITGLLLPLAFDESAAFLSTATVALRADRGYWRTVSGDTVVYF